MIMVHYSTIIKVPFSILKRIETPVTTSHEWWVDRQAEAFSILKRIETPVTLSPVLLMKQQICAFSILKRIETPVTAPLPKESHAQFPQK